MGPVFRAMEWAGGSPTAGQVAFAGEVEGRGRKELPEAGSLQRHFARIRHCMPASSITVLWMGARKALREEGTWSGLLKSLWSIGFPMHLLATKLPALPCPALQDVLCEAVIKQMVSTIHRGTACPALRRAFFLPGDFVLAAASFFRIFSSLLVSGDGGGQ